MLITFFPVIILCTEFQSAERRILKAAQKADMMNGQYVYFIPDQLPPPNVRTPWVTGDSQEEDDILYQAYKHVFLVNRIYLISRGQL